ncbi:hypothetical protein D3C76_1135990 [compost metagenome]
MPCSVERFISGLSSWTSPLRIRSAASGVFSSTSITARRPLPSGVGTSCWATMALRFSDRSIHTWPCRSAGKKWMIRSSAWLALLACRVARHRWPVSAKATA